MLAAEKIAAITNNNRHNRFGRNGEITAAIEPTMNRIYPHTPQSGTGSFQKTEYGLWETVSQLMALETAQKLLYSISV